MSQEFYDSSKIDMSQRTALAKNKIANTAACVSS